MGINIIFRLGYSAEFKTPTRHVAPPDSYERWAKVVAHIVRHYNEGWADGPKAKIKYWEVWNEPDGDSFAFWRGTPDSFYRLYEVTARKLKSLDSTLKVGGPAMAGSFSFLEGFLKYSQQHQVPVDFISWHIYTQDPHEVAERANKIHDLQLRYKFPKAQNILDEWNYGPTDWKKLFVDPVASREYFDATQSSLGAAFDAAVMIRLQDTPIDIATLYSGTTFMWGLFTPSGAPQKPYYAFLAFQRLLETPNRIALPWTNRTKLSALAGISEDKSTIHVLLTNLDHKRRVVRLELKDLPWRGPSQYEERIINSGHDLDIVKSGIISLPSSSLEVEVDGPSVSLITIRPGP